MLKRNTLKHKMLKQKAFKKWLKTSQAKRLFSLCRWLHIYISTALFSLLLFFCVTGITLNHPQWGTSSLENTIELPLPNHINQTIAGNDELPIKAIQQFIEWHTGLTNPRNIDVMPDLGEITYDYPLPAGYAFVTVLIEEALVEIAYKEGTFIGLLNDLHKGRHSGEVWQWLIDISAALMLLFTFTGLFILLQNAKHRRKSLLVLLLGSLTPVLMYLIWVPRLAL